MAGITGMPSAGAIGAGGAGPSASMLDGSAQQQAMEESFKEFCSRPENKAVMEAHQRKEMKKQEKQRMHMEAARFQEIVLASEYDAQKSIAPFLKYPVLRKIIQTFTNDPNGDFGKWATNPRVLSMLHTAKKQIDEGRMTEHEIETTMLNYITGGFESSGGPGGTAGGSRSSSRSAGKSNNAIGMTEDEFKLRTRQQVRLTTDQLVPALNEHLKERSRGNDLYKAGKFDAAIESYNKSLAIVDYVVGVSSADQHEIDLNKMAVLLNLAAAYMEKKEFGAAVTYCDRAIKINPKNLKAHVRRCRALIGRRDYAEASADIETIKQLDPFGADAGELSARLSRVKKADAEKEIFRNVL